MTSKQKLRALDRSINRALDGMTKIIHCPYCDMDLDFTPPAITESADWQPPTCCATFALAAIEIMKRREQRDMKDLASRIRDNVGGAAVFN